ncbi:MAG: class I SAM-dependent methyltransferase [Thiotrichales bacterium]|nr:class I SAM-dependent methyltransferase [Thiotrichales bacterium]
MPKTTGYEQHSADYDQWFDENPELYQAEIAAIQQLLPDGKGLEIGAGSGRFTQPLKIDTGIEPAAAMRQRAQQMRGLTLVDGVAEALPFAEQSFDFTTFITSTCFLDDPLKAYREAARVTRQGGYLLVAFLERDSELGQQYEKHKAQSPFYCDATFYHYAQIVEFMKQAGWSPEQSVQTVLPPSSGYSSQVILPGHECGTFIVLRARKIEHPSPLGS